MEVKELWKKHTPQNTISVRVGEGTMGVSAKYVAFLVGML